MTATTLAPDLPLARPPRTPGLVRQLLDVVVLTGRNLVHIAREPLQLSDVTVQPVLFTLLFVYVFGSGVVLPHGGSYTDFAIAGLLALNLTTSAMGTAVGLSADLGSGVIDRFRTLPMWRPAMLVGRSLADLLTAAICTAFVAVTGLAHRLAAGRRHRIDDRRVRDLPLLQLRPVVDLCVPRHGQQEPRIRAEHGPRHLLSARDRLQRAGSDAAHAAGATDDRQLEPRQRGHRRGTRAVRQPQPVLDDPRLADAASGARLAALVGRDPRDLRAARDTPLPPPHHRLSTSFVKVRTGHTGLG